MMQSCMHAEASPGRWGALFRKLTPAKDKATGQGRTSLFRRKAVGATVAPSPSKLMSPGSLCHALVAQPIPEASVRRVYHDLRAIAGL